MSSFNIPPNVGHRTAPELYGMLFNFGLMGSLIVQVYQYYTSFPGDPRTTKGVVYSIFLLELIQTGIMSYFAYTIFGSGYGNLVIFDKSALEWFPVCILGSLIAGTVQIFYAHRVYTFSRSKIIGGIIVLSSHNHPDVSKLALLQIGSGIGQGVISKLVTDRSNLATKPICVTIWLLSSAICDLTIASCMTFYLKRRRFLSVHTNKVVTKLVRYTIETGAITALAAIIQVVVFLAFPADNFFETPSWTLGKLYSNNLLVLLNARAQIVGGRNPNTASSNGGVYINEIQLDSRGGVTASPLHQSLTQSAPTRNLTAEFSVDSGKQKMKFGSSKGNLNENSVEDV
ncbi:hypothetical protein GYMLUDRAFT_240157 [Collybiopsis luxurians FD-317 M1]|nr:hypothetical protein GYMLUDRAFT_240157 [Collybiopsis luxurians FD-317 M1]